MTKQKKYVTIKLYDKQKGCAMSLTKYLRGLIVASVLPTSPLIAAQQDEQPDKEATVVTQESEKAISLNGIQLPLSKNLNFIPSYANLENILDPEKKHRSKENPNLIDPDKQITTGVISTQTKRMKTDSLDESDRTIISGENRSIAGENNVISGCYLSKNGELTEISHLLKNQTDLLNLQQWYQDSMNKVLKSNLAQDQKQENLKILAHGMAASMEPSLQKILPNPENKKTLTCDKDFIQKKIEEANKSGKPIKLDGLNQSPIPLHLLKNKEMQK